MLISENVPLGKLNTFGLRVSARYFISISNAGMLTALFPLPAAYEPHMILGGGSNVLFTKDYPGLVVHIASRGKEVIRETTTHVWLKVQAGEPWDELVGYCVANGWGGLENLSLIPGYAGSSPIQNIGAYGVELKDVFDHLEAFNKNTGKTETFDRQACAFGYRNSFFKTEGRDRYIISAVCFCLKKAPHSVHTTYQGLQDELSAMGISQPSVADIRQAVINIRTRKLPDPEVTGNAGSFFKNPLVSHEQFRALQQTFPGIPSYPDSQGIKLAAGWLIEQAGWKGYREGEAGVHQHQALVLVNHGNATGDQILRLAHSIQDSVQKKFNIELLPEVNFY